MLARDWVAHEVTSVKRTMGYSLFRHVSWWVSEVKAIQIIAMPRRKRATHMNVHYIMSVGKRAWY